eukprot:983314-Alexandrium_andersonii.AAC.1
MPLIAWLHSHAHRSLRLFLPSPDAEGDNRHVKSRAVLPEPAWLRDRCKRLGVELGPPPAEHAGPLQLHGLVELAPGQAFKGPLTDWCNEAGVLFDYLGRPMDSFTAR